MKYYLESREVLAAAYLGGLRKGRPMLSHAVTVDERGVEVRVICGRVRLDSIADGGAADTTAEPTCRSCRKKTRGMTFGRPPRVPLSSVVEDEKGQ